MHYSRSNNAVIRVYDAAGNVIEMHEQAGERPYQWLRTAGHDSPDLIKR
jgi:hypothetical protein